MMKDSKAIQAVQKINHAAGADLTPEQEEALASLLAGFHDQRAARDGLWKAAGRTGLRSLLRVA